MTATQSGQARSSSNENRRGSGSGSVGKGGTKLHLDGAMGFDEAKHGKRRRVRTGCLTCRERHTKCDEDWPECFNCRKGNRFCRRGLRISFADINVANITPPADAEPWQFGFEDETMAICEEYTVVSASPAPDPSTSAFDSARWPAAVEDSSPLPGTTGVLEFPGPLSISSSITPPEMPSLKLNTMHEARRRVMPEDIFPPPLKGPIRDAQEAELFKTFAKSIASGMDLWTDEALFGKLLLPYFREYPLLFNAVAACAACHVKHFDGNFNTSHELYYYKQSTQILLRHLQDPQNSTNRPFLALASVLLNTYEHMSELDGNRLRHVAGARYLIEASGWNASSKGIGASCFWNNVAMDVLGAMGMNWKVAWDPDEWNMPSDCTTETDRLQRIVYLAAQMTKYCASRRQIDSITPPLSQTQTPTVWFTALRKEIIEWEEHIPPAMRPISSVPHDENGYCDRVSYASRQASLAMLFYHSSQMLLLTCEPAMEFTMHYVEMEEVAFHARQVCGIIYGTEDPVVLALSLRPLLIASTCAKDISPLMMGEIMDRVRKLTSYPLRI